MVRSKVNKGKYRPSRGWVFTINNYTEEDVYRCGGIPLFGGAAGQPGSPKTASSSLPNIATLPGGAAGQPAACDVDMWKAAGPSASCRYLVCGREVGEEGTPHLQGYMYFKEEKSMKQVSEMLPRARLEQAKGNLNSNIKYCGKGKDFWTIGLAGQGARNDLLNIKEMIKNGADESEIAEAHFGDYVRYHAGISKAVRLMKPDEENIHFPPRYPLMGDFKNVVLIGPSQVGKSQYARAHFKNPLFLRHMDKLLEFNPRKHDGIIFDDMDFKHMPRTAQIHLTDWNDPSEIHIRYNYAKIPRNTRKIFCCNEYPFIYDQHNAIENRVQIITMDVNGKPNL